jgi:valyl-tRNA synthetase
LQELIVSIRAVRKDLSVEERLTVPVRIRAAEAIQRDFDVSGDIVARLARVSSIEFISEIPEGSGIRSTPDFDVQVIYQKQVDVVAERERLGKDLSRFEKEQANADRQLGNDAFLSKAPISVVEGIRRRAGELVVLLEKTRKALEDLHP